jgi:prepilin-type N-terminal cleavage/methylation domain-containing protein
LHGESGFTLPEVIIAMSLSLGIAAALMTFMIVSIDQGNAIASRAYATGQAEPGLEQLVRDLRDAMSQNAAGTALSVTVSNPTTTTTSISLSIPTPGADTTPQTVTWTCPSTGATSVGICTRTVGSGGAIHEIRGALSMAFAPYSSGGVLQTLTATNPAYVGITLNLQVTSVSNTTRTTAVQGITKPIVIQTGADLRNFA